MLRFNAEMRERKREINEKATKMYTDDDFYCECLSHHFWSMNNIIGGLFAHCHIKYISYTIRDK